MRFKLLGRTGLYVSELCLGTMTFGQLENSLFTHVAGLGQGDADALVKAARDAGVNFFDTADVYSAGQSEEMLGQSVKNLGLNRDEIVIATKALGRMHDGPNGAGASRGHIMAAVKQSLRRLKTDFIDLYQIHGVDQDTPIEETMEALDALVRQGHIRYVGVSNWAAWQVAKAQGIAAAKNLSRIASLQAYYTVAGRDLEREIVPMLASEGVGLMVWSPLAGGFLSGKYTRGNEQAGEGRRAKFNFPPVDLDRGYAVIDALKAIADAKGKTVAQIALAWLLAQKAVTSVIIGAKRPDQLADNLGAVDVELSSDDLAALDAVSKLPAEYPGWMIARQSGYRATAPAAR